MEASHRSRDTCLVPHAQACCYPEVCHTRETGGKGGGGRQAGDYRCVSPRISSKEGRICGPVFAVLRRGKLIQTLLGHSDVKTTEIDTHVAKGVGAMGVVSPLDRMGF